MIKEFVKTGRLHAETTKIKNIINTQTQTLQTIKPRDRVALEIESSIQNRKLKYLNLIKGRVRLTTIKPRGLN